MSSFKAKPENGLLSNFVSLVVAAASAAAFAKHYMISHHIISDHTIWYHIIIYDKLLYHIIWNHKPMGWLSLKTLLIWALFILVSLLCMIFVCPGNDGRFSCFSSSGSSVPIQFYFKCASATRTRHFGWAWDQDLDVGTPDRSRQFRFNSFRPWKNTNHLRDTPAYRAVLKSICFFQAPCSPDLFV